MANSYTVLADLRAGRFWEAKNINRGGQLMSVEMLLIDEQSSVVQGSVPAALKLMFRERMTERSVYTLSGFDVTRSNPKFRLSDAPFTIRFNDGTAFEKMATTERKIPTEHFRFRSYDQILELSNTGKQLPDVMGELRAIRSTITDRLPGPQRVMLTLRLEGNADVCVSLFDSLALAFHNKFDVYGREPKIVLVTGINPKIVSGKLYLNGTSATRVFFDCETAVGKAAFDRLPGGGTDQEGSSSKVVHAQKIEPLTIAELNQFVVTGDPQIIERSLRLHVPCAIKPMLSLNSGKLTDSSLLCDRYRVVFSVSDVTGTAAFVGFDKEVTKLTHVLASEAAHIVGVGVNAQVDSALPRSLAGIVGNTYTFQLKLTDFNFTPNHQTFTISRIFPARELAPIPTFTEGAEGPVPAAPQTVAPGTDAIGATACTVSEQPSTSDGPLAGREAAGEEEIDLEGSVPKKARVE
ncbi:hypothetical protein Bca52824_001178 [Brassica carinata]|uniref:Uncharacterized protein n=1 Tax=Brassica carinata TaxID=52824 RepID=A0A8X7WL06_BRACI|nr:hypothetical protein Bca52824_001178 [Brassica carinata]